MFGVFACFILSGCAATYVAPTAPEPDTARMIPGTQSALMAAAKQALTADGYQITSADSTAGTISTAPRALLLTPDPYTLDDYSVALGMGR